MSGCSLTVLIGVIEKFSGVDIPYPVYVGILVLFVFVACFLAWIDARQEMNRLSVEIAKKEQELLDKDALVLDKTRTITELRQELLEVKEKRTPHMEATIDWISAADIVIQGIKHSAVTIQISVRNLGMTSIATDWIPTMSVVGKEPLQFQYFHVSGELTLGYKSGNAFVIKGKDMIYEKTSNPLQTGDKAVGYMHFRVPFTTDEVMTDSTIMQVFFSDVTGKTYNVTYERNKSFPLTEPSYVPGVDVRRNVIAQEPKKRRKQHQKRR